MFTNVQLKTKQNKNNHKIIINNRPENSPIYREIRVTLLGVVHNDDKGSGPSST